MLENIATGQPMKAREFSYTSQVMTLMLGHFIQAFSRHEICEVMTLHANKVCRTRGITPPKRNTFETNPGSFKCRMWNYDTPGPFMSVSNRPAKMLPIGK